jgi:DNA transformation protein
MGELSKLPNIGKSVEAQLEQVGISSFEDLKQMGAEKAWLEIQKIDDSACINRLLALEGAIQGIKKVNLPESRKDELRKFYYEHKL